MPHFFIMITTYVLFFTPQTSTVSNGKQIWSLKIINVIFTIQTTC